MPFYRFLLLALLLLYTLFSAPIDLLLSSHFYRSGLFPETPFTNLLYQWGELPGLLLGGAALSVYLSTFVTDFLSRWKKMAATIALASLLGPGLLVHGVKEVWGRPRPKVVEQFGGIYDFRPVYRPDFTVEGRGKKSFPSGHASMGFFFLCAALAAKREGRRGLFYSLLLFALTLGSLLGFARLSQGGHFFSDSLFAALFMWAVASVSCRIVYKDYSNSSSS